MDFFLIQSKGLVLKGSDEEVRHIVDKNIPVKRLSIFDCKILSVRKLINTREESIEDQVKEISVVFNLVYIKVQTLDQVFLPRVRIFSSWLHDF